MNANNKYVLLPSPRNIRNSLLKTILEYLPLPPPSPSVGHVPYAENHNVRNVRRKRMENHV